jgi:hypothetical protein
MAGLRPMGPVSQRTTIVLTITRPCKDPGQGMGVLGTPTSVAAISASTLARLARPHAIPS